MNVIVVDYDPRWKADFEEESQKIKDLLGDQLVEAHHIGSTSVKGLKSKPIIDIMLIVRDIAKVDGFNPQFEELGYEPMGELGISGRRYFRKGGSDRTHQIHTFQKEDRDNIVRHIAVRDYLIEHPETAVRYGELKAELAKLFPKDICGYGDGKEAYMRNLERRALTWYNQG